MPKLTPKKTFLLRQINEDGKKSKDVIAYARKPIEVTNEEAVQFAGYWDVREDAEKKKVMDASKIKKDAKRIV
jgi:hypothetical protein